MFSSLVLSNLGSHCAQLISEPLGRTRSLECSRDPGRHYRQARPYRINGPKKNTQEPTQSGKQEVEPCAILGLSCGLELPRRGQIFEQVKR